MRAVEELLSRAPGRFDITVIGAEPHPNYNRILLSSVLAGDKTLNEIVINSPSWYVDLHQGTSGRLGFVITVSAVSYSLHRSGVAYTGAKLQMR